MKHSHNLYNTHIYIFNLLKKREFIELKADVSNWVLDEALIISSKTSTFALRRYENVKLL